MTREQMPARRGLAPLDERLQEPERRCAERLRELRARTGLSSEDLAERLSGDGIRVDRTRLSKFLNGREVPRREIAARLHALAAECEGVDVNAEEVAATRALMYAAACVRSPLQAREFELATAREDLDRHRAEAVQELADLQRDLHDERKRRQDAEDALEDLALHSREEVRALTEERDTALDRIAQLEDQIRQAGAVLRLRDRDTETLDRITRATDAELAVWESGGTGDLAGICASVAYLRDADEDAAADRIIEQIALGHPVGDIVRLANEFRSLGRFHDSVKIEHSLVRLRKPVDLFHWFAGESRWSKERVRLLESMTVVAPVEHLARLHKACTDHGNGDLDFDLLSSIVERPRAVPEGTGDEWVEDLRRSVDVTKQVLTEGAVAGPAQQEVSAAGSAPVDR
ncbi:helix-turn-helix domain-containing protein [Kitasatospora sp. NPDC048545]|uniref:helix-turn-helix domain-containing protein n=1 Tax=Kitasatospora sp. NPDC048545 TaxID=3157208 RepID=UPI0033D86309